MIPASLRGLLPPGVGIALRRLTDAAPPLWPGEAEAVARAVPARQREFASGRAAARAAMAGVGWPAQALPAGPDRAPLWPAGLVGSISHTRSWAGAVVAQQSDWAGIGFDLEPATPMPDDLAAMVLAPGDQPGDLLPPALAAKLIFSVKEAAFKAQFPLTGLWLDHRDVAVRLSPGAFSLCVRDVALKGRWVQTTLMQDRTMQAGGMPTTAMFASVLLVGAEQGRQLGGLGMDVMA